MLTLPSPAAGAIDPPFNTELRARLFWCARWMLGGAMFHAGFVEVVIRDGPPARCGASVVVRPRPGEEVYDAEARPAPADVLPRLLAAMLSADEWKIVTALGERGALAAKAVSQAAGIERSKCYALLANLAARGLIADRGDGYEVSAPDLVTLAAVAGARAGG